MDADHDNLQLDCRGMKCPRPIVEIAKLRRRESGPVLVRVTGDDLAFESDVRAWCEVTGNALKNLSSDQGNVVATIEFGARA
ncbi:MAG: sulfurtransferase TusA family protein [Deltaproteobacteria bacterium]|nr:sulfurtransferase TusA family protein [Deltaproteobacteria bacterium]